MVNDLWEREWDVSGGAKTSKFASDDSPSASSTTTTTTTTSSAAARRHFAADEFDLLPSPPVIKSPPQSSPPALALVEKGHVAGLLTKFAAKSGSPPSGAKRKASHAIASSASSNPTKSGIAAPPNINNTAAALHQRHGDATDLLAVKTPFMRGAIISSDTEMAQSAIEPNECRISGERNPVSAPPKTNSSFSHHHTQALRIDDTGVDPNSFATTARSSEMETKTRLYAKRSGERKTEQSGAADGENIHGVDAKAGGRGKTNGVAIDDVMRDTPASSKFPHSATTMRDPITTSPPGSKSSPPAIGSANRTSNTQQNEERAGGDEVRTFTTLRKVAQPVEKCGIETGRVIETTITTRTSASVTTSDNCVVDGQRQAVAAAAKQIPPAPPPPPPPLSLLSPKTVGKKNEVLSLQIRTHLYVHSAL